MTKEDEIYVEHITNALRTIVEYTRTLNRTSFLDSQITQDAVIRQLEIVGEATKRISQRLKDINPDVPWKEMAGMRDKLIHDYIDVDLWVVWDTVQSDVPKLMKLLNDLHI
ncbi:MAG: DUF86 domain-containing protein [Bacteroidota bacterium]